jgi:hypothetical protein
MGKNTADQLRAEGFNREAVPRPASAADLATLRSLYAEAVAAHGRMMETLPAGQERSDRVRHIRNAIGNPDEFLSWALENANFQAFLREQPGKAPGEKSLWDRIVDFIRRALGLGDVSRTALDDALDVAYRLLAEAPTGATNDNSTFPTVDNFDRGDLEAMQRRSALQEADPVESPAFYSALERAVEKSPQARASAAQWAATLAKTPGVKREELEWSGLFEWLDMQKGQVDREALLKVVREGGIKVTETVLSGELGDPYLVENDQGEWEVRDGFEVVGTFATEEEARSSLRNPSQFISWSSDPDNPTYRELLIQLPLGEGGNPTRAPATHWDRDAVIAHARFMEKQDAEGRRVLFVEEVQSDWHQKGRDEGYERVANAEEIAAAEKAEAGARAAWHAASERARAGAYPLPLIVSGRVRIPPHSTL